MVREVAAGNVTFGGGRPLVLIAGPCAIEEEALTLRIAGFLKKLTGDLGIGLVFKASYDKANRTSVTSFRGPGMARITSYNVCYTKLLRVRTICRE